MNNILLVDPLYINPTQGERLYYVSTHAKVRRQQQLVFIPNLNQLDYTGIRGVFSRCPEVDTALC